MMGMVMDTTSHLEGRLDKGMEGLKIQPNRTGSFLRLEVNLQLQEQAVEVLLDPWLAFQMDQSRASMGFPMGQDPEEWHEQTPCPLRWVMAYPRIRHPFVRV